MDPKVYLFVFMALLTIVLADYLQAYKYGDSGVMDDKLKSYLPAYKFGKTGREAHYNKEFFISNISDESSRKIKQSNHRKTKVRRTANSNINNMTIYETDEIVRNNNEDKIKHRKSKTVKRDESNINEQTDSGSTEIENTDVTNIAEEISTEPPKTDRRLRRLRKFDKKYRPQFKYIKLDGKRYKKYNSENRKIDDTPDNAEEILEESHEVNKKVLPKIQKQSHKKATEYIVQYESFDDSRPVNEEIPKEKSQVSIPPKKEQNELKIKNLEVIEDPAVSQKKYKPVFQFSNVNRRHFSNDYSEIIDAGVEIEEITTTATSTTTKKPETTITYGKTEIIYLTPNPSNKKYKPEFKYLVVHNEPYNYDTPHNNNKDKDKNKSDVSDNSKSESKESGETNDNKKVEEETHKNPKIKAKTAADSANKEDNDDNSRRRSTEDDESDSVEKSKETRVSVRHNQLLKVSRKIRARERPTFDIGKHYDDTIQNKNTILHEIVNKHENIKQHKNPKQHANPKQHEKIKQQDNIDEKQQKRGKLRNRNYRKKKVILQPIKKLKKDVIPKTNGHSKIFHTEMRTYNKTNMSRLSRPIPMSSDGRMEAILQDRVKERYEPVLQYNKQSNKVRDKLFGKYTTKISQYYHDSDSPITFKEDNMIYQPDIEYSKQYNHVREKFFEKRSTPDEIMIFPPPELKKNYQAGLVGFERTRRPTLEQKVVDILYADDHAVPQEVDNEYGDEQTVPDRVTTVLPSPDLKRSYKAVLEDLERKRTAILEEKLGDTPQESEPLFRDERIVPEIVTTELSTTDIVREKLEPLLEYTKLDYNVPDDGVSYVKRSTRYHKVKAVKIKKAKDVEKMTTPSEEITTMSDYGDTNVDHDKETENTPSYQVHENIVDIPDNRAIPGPIAPDYVIVPERHVPFPSRNHRIVSPLLNSTDYDPEHRIVNIVQGMKDYFTVIGKGLYDTVKDIFNEKS